MNGIWLSHSALPHLLMAGEFEVPALGCLTCALRQALGALLELQGGGEGDRERWAERPHRGEWVPLRGHIGGSGSL